MTVAAETYTQLMSDPAHLGFEVTLTLIQDVLIGVVLWPLIKRLVRRHDRRKHNTMTRPHRLVDRTRGSQPCNAGSNPAGVTTNVRSDSTKEVNQMRQEERRLVEDCKVVRTLLEVDGEVPQWISLTACVEDAPAPQPCNCTDVRCGWVAP